MLPSRLLTMTCAPPPPTVSERPCGPEKLTFATEGSSMFTTVPPKLVATMLAPKPPHTWMRAEPEPRFTRYGPVLTPLTVHSISPLCEKNWARSSWGPDQIAMRPAPVTTPMLPCGLRTSTLPCVCTQPMPATERNVTSFSPMMMYGPRVRSISTGLAPACTYMSSIRLGTPTSRSLPGLVIETPCGPSRKGSARGVQPPDCCSNVREPWRGLNACGRGTQNVPIVCGLTLKRFICTPGALPG